jgi:hypothetical protein
MNVIGPIFLSNSSPKFHVSIPENDQCPAQCRFLAFHSIKVGKVLALPLYTALSARDSFGMKEEKAGARREETGKRQDGGEY